MIASFIILYLASAQHGNPVGQANLASLYFTGVGTPRDYALAAKWFRIAADLGVPAAQHNLAVFYFKGIALPVDYSEAAHWERLAAEQGDPDAQTDLAYLYETGKGVPLNYVLAYNWYTRAIDAGDRSGSARRSSLSHLLTRKQLDEATALASAQSSQPQQQPNLPPSGRFLPAQRPLILISAASFQGTIDVAASQMEESKARQWLGGA